MIMPFIEQAESAQPVGGRQPELGPDQRRRQSRCCWRGCKPKFPVYRCPSDNAPDLNGKRLVGGRQFGLSNYAAVNGSLLFLHLGEWYDAESTPGNPATYVGGNGVIFMDSKIDLREITDGISNTLARGRTRIQVSQRGPLGRHNQRPGRIFQSPLQHQHRGIHRPGPRPQDQRPECQRLRQSPPGRGAVRVLRRLRAFSLAERSASGTARRRRPGACSIKLGARNDGFTVGTYE